MRLGWCTVIVGLVVGYTLALSVPGLAQDIDYEVWEAYRTRLGIGYVINAPLQAIGGGVLVGPRVLKGWGVYLDFKMSNETPHKGPHFVPGLTSGQVIERYAGDDLVAMETVWTSVNAGIAKSVGPETVLYLGVGRSDAKGYQQFYDDLHDRGISGYYWVEHPEDNKVELNLIGGAFIDLGSLISLQFGLESAPRGFTVGAYLNVPGLGR